MYARVTIASRDMEPELECFDPGTGKAEGFGELKGGLILESSLQMCRRCVLRATQRPAADAVACSIRSTLCYPCWLVKSRSNVRLVSMGGYG